MTLTLREFDAGADYWANRTRWPKDYHSAFYVRLAQENPRGDFTPAWWQMFMAHLQAWRALRPASPDVVSREVAQALPDLTATWRSACLPYVDRDVTGVAWAQVGAFPDLVAQLKPRPDGRGHVRSPVFRAKFCHFLAPAIFPVVDNAVMGLPFGLKYQTHLEGVQREWAETAPGTRQQLSDALAAQIGAPIPPGYPLVNKVVEICLIGRRQRT